MKTKALEKTQMKLKPLGSNQTTIELADGTVILFSYETPVAAFVPGQGYCATHKYFSRTTSKHITQWLRANGSSGAAVSLRPQSFFDNLARGTA